jgi:hypothetical protein
VSYQSIDGSGQIIRHTTDRGGRHVVTPLPTETLECDRCHWRTRAVMGGADLERCLCGGTMHLAGVKRDRG